MEEKIPVVLVTALVALLVIVSTVVGILLAKDKKIGRYGKYLSARIILSLSFGLVGLIIFLVEKFKD